MLQVNQLIGFGAAESGGAAATVSHTATTNTNANQTTFTHSSVAIGTAASGRRIVVIASTVTGDNRTVDSITVGGNAATAVMATASRDNSGGGTYALSRMFIVQVDSGTTADIVVTWSGAVSRSGITVHAIYDLLSSTATATDTELITTGTATASLDISAGGVAIGGGATFGNATHTWGNLTETADSNYDASVVCQTSAALAFAAAQTGLSITCQPSATTAAAYVFASFR